MPRIKSSTRPELTMALPAPDPRPPITTSAEMIGHIRTVIHRMGDIRQAEDTWPALKLGEALDRSYWRSMERYVDELSCD